MGTPLELIGVETYFIPLDIGYQGSFQHNRPTQVGETANSGYRGD